MPKWLKNGDENNPQKPKSVYPNGYRPRCLPCFPTCVFSRLRHKRISNTRDLRICHVYIRLTPPNLLNRLRGFGPVSRHSQFSSQHRSRGRHFHGENLLVQSQFYISLSFLFLIAWKVWSSSPFHHRFSLRLMTSLIRFNLHSFFHII